MPPGPTPEGASFRAEGEKTCDLTVADSADCSLRFTPLELTEGDSLVTVSHPDDHDLNPFIHPHTWED